MTSEAEKEAGRKMMEASIIGRALLAGSGTFLTGVNTYLMKLGPDNLGAYAAPLDRQIAAHAASVALRMRVQDVARMEAEALAPALAASPGRPLHFVNIAGGPAIDNMNALILLRHDHPWCSRGTPDRSSTCSIRTQAGPAFGAAGTGGAAGAGREAARPRRDVHPRVGTTGATQPDLRGLSTLELDAAVWAASSEGGLFEYGDDEAIVSNLQVPASSRFRRHGDRAGHPRRGAGCALSRSELRRDDSEHPGRVQALAERGGWASTSMSCYSTTSVVNLQLV